MAVTDQALAPLGAVALAQGVGYTPAMIAVAVASVIAAFALHRVSFRQMSKQEAPS
ncbi:MAG: hypothetical protein HOY71_27585 [Nonomuraea sp.]|nr:hypothetical protein [Nonomuraea sp.]